MQTKQIIVSSLVLSQFILIQAHSPISLSGSTCCGLCKWIKFLKRGNPKVSPGPESVCFNTGCWLHLTATLQLSQSMFLLWDLGDFQSSNLRSCPVVPIFAYTHVKCSCSIQTCVIPHFPVLWFSQEGTEHSALI